MCCHDDGGGDGSGRRETVFARGRWPPWLIATGDVDERDETMEVSLLDGSEVCSMQRFGGHATVERAADLACRRDRGLSAARATTAAAHDVEEASISQSLRKRPCSFPT